MQKQIPQLDAVRGVAILVVMAHNLKGFSSPPFGYITRFGWMGVDLFFVLSGFLITGILLDTKPSKDYFRNFYARRCLRIWPLYYSTLVLMLVIVPMVHPQGSAEIFRRSNPWWSYPFFLQNFLVADPALGVGPLGVSWSLAVEELFYLVWPVLVRFLPARGLSAVAWGIFLISPALRLFFDSRHWLIYSNPFCRLDGMMAGALLALLVRKADFNADKWIFPAWIAILVAGALAIFTEVCDARWITFSLDALASGGFVYVSMYSRSAWFQWCMTNRFLRFSGTISYGLYLLHKLPQDAFKTTSLYASHPALSFWAAVVISYALAFASWNLLEKPFLRLKRFFSNDAVRPNMREVSPRRVQDSEVG